MKRRTFAGLLAAVGAALALPLMHPLLPRRWTEAVRARLYPGPVRALNPAGIRGPARWAG